MDFIQLIMRRKRSEALNNISTGDIWGIGLQNEKKVVKN
ncbi:MAG: hypothetical protein CM15mP102_00370 [Flavobacteriales bacterium]|nr:MAG: hypothetical protein CM15mP102_00370 [Flavobacteriales bacterium]